MGAASLVNAGRNLVANGTFDLRTAVSNLLTKPSTAEVMEASSARGAGVRRALGSRVSSLGSRADDAYSNLRAIEADPRNVQTVQTVQTGTKTVDTGVVDSSGQSIQRSVPVTKDIALPADLSAAQKLLQPVYDQMTKLIPIAQQQASKGFAAIKNILDADPVMPASEAEQNLSALKAAQREAPNAQSARLLNMAVDQMSGAGHKAVAAGGPEAVDALQQGRALTKAKYATQATLDSLRTEPVQLFNQLTYSKDTGVNLLRDVAAKAPDAIPAVGRAYLDGLMEKGLRGSGERQTRTGAFRVEDSDVPRRSCGARQRFQSAAALSGRGRASGQPDSQYCRKRRGRRTT